MGGSFALKETAVALGTAQDKEGKGKERRGNEKKGKGEEREEKKRKGKEREGVSCMRRMN